jgi:hypothetical protein
MSKEEIDEAKVLHDFSGYIATSSGTIVACLCRASTHTAHTAYSANTTCATAV